MIVLVAFLALYVVAAVGQLPPPLGKNIDRLEVIAYAERVPQKRDVALKRQDLVGSWSLRAVTCPDNTQNCDVSSLAMLACCPKSSVCSTYIYRVACCPTSSRCDATAATFPKCGDPAWTLWAGGADQFFCCQAGEIGYLTKGNMAACGPSSLKPTGSQVATSVQNVGGDQPLQTSGPSGSSTGNTSTSTTPNSSRTSISSEPSVTPSMSATTKGDSPTDTSRTGNSQNQNGSSNPTSTSGLPTGAIAGIAAGGVIILILAGVAVFFALKAGKNKGHAEALAAFQQEQRNLPGNNTYQSGVSTPGAAVPPMSPLPPPPQLQSQWNSDNSSVIVEKYGETRQVPPNAPLNTPLNAVPPPPPQWSAPTNYHDGPSYEADATNIYPSSTHAEMDGYQNQRGY